MKKLQNDFQSIEKGIQMNEKNGITCFIVPIMMNPSRRVENATIDILY
jgi:hypothetical protein